MSKYPIPVSIDSVTAAIQLARYRTAGLFVRDRLGAPLIIGSGVLYASVSGPGLLTATHVIHAAQRRRRGLLLAAPTIPSTDSKAELVSLQGCRVEPILLPDREVSESTLDLCLVRLTYSQAEQLPETAHWVTRSEITLHNEAITDPAFLVFGFPVDAMTLSPLRWMRRARPLCLITERYDEARGVWPAESADLYLDVSYRPRRLVSTVAGRWLFAPQPPGISGCGIWTVPTEPEGSAPRLVAIEHRWHRIAEVLRGSLLLGLHDELAPFDPAWVSD